MCDSLRTLFQEAERKLRRTGEFPEDPEEQLRHTYGSHLFLGKGAAIRHFSPVLLDLLGFKEGETNPAKQYDVWPPILFSNLDPTSRMPFASEPILRVCPFLAVHGFHL